MAVFGVLFKAQGAEKRRSWGIGLERVPGWLTGPSRNAMNERPPCCPRTAIRRHQLHHPLGQGYPLRRLGARSRQLVMRQPPPRMLHSARARLAAAARSKFLPQP